MFDAIAARFVSQLAPAMHAHLRSLSTNDLAHKFGRGLATAMQAQLNK